MLSRTAGAKMVRRHSFLPSALCSLPLSHHAQAEKCLSPEFKATIHKVSGRRLPLFTPLTYSPHPEKPPEKEGRTDKKECVAHPFTPSLV